MSGSAELGGVEAEGLEGVVHRDAFGAQELRAAVFDDLDLSPRHDAVALVDEEPVGVDRAETTCLVDAEAEADSFFPPYEKEFTKKVFEEAHEWNGLKYRCVDLER